MTPTLLMAIALTLAGFAGTAAADDHDEPADPLPGGLPPILCRFTCAKPLDHTPPPDPNGCRPNC